MTEQKFNTLFKKYRLKSEFESLSQFGQAMAEQGRILDDSTFTHWQNGTRTPKDRSILLTMIKVFIQRGGITSFQEANNLLESSGQGYLTTSEIEILPNLISPNTPFQVPNEIANFTGRQTILKKFHASSITGKKILLYGPSGTGKTALAIQIAHQTKHLFPDGILWYKVDNTNPMDILLSIAYTFHDNVSPIQDLESRASVVRSLLANKKILLILDNVEPQTNLRVLLPNSSTTVIFTSKQKVLPLDSQYETISVEKFDKQEILNLFNKIISEDYTKQYQQEIIELANRVGNLPLALQIYAKQLTSSRQSPRNLLKLIERNKIELKDLNYEDKTLYNSIDISYQSLDRKTQKVFLSLSIFEGKDFAPQSVAAVNKLTKNETQKYLQKLIEISLLELSTKNRYRLHPFMKIYIRNNTSNRSLYKLAANYYVKFLKRNKWKNITFYNFNIIDTELENILHIFNKCLQGELYTELIELWKHLGELFFQIGQWDKGLSYGYLIYEVTKTINDYKNHVQYSITLLSRIEYLRGNPNKSLELVSEALQISENLHDGFLIAISKQQLGKIYQTLGDLSKSIKLLTESYEILKKYNYLDNETLAYNYKYLGETYMFQMQHLKAIESLEQANVATENNILLFTIITALKGTVYYSIKDFEKAEKCLLKAIKLEKRYQIRIGVRLFSHLILALIKDHQRKFREAELHFLKAKQENFYLNIGANAEKSFAPLFLIKEDLKSAGYYIFD